MEVVPVINKRPGSGFKKITFNSNVTVYDIPSIDSDFNYNNEEMASAIYGVGVHVGRINDETRDLSTDSSNTASSLTSSLSDSRVSLPPFSPPPDLPRSPQLECDPPTIPEPINGQAVPKILPISAPPLPTLAAGESCAENIGITESSPLPNPAIHQPAWTFSLRSLVGALMFAISLAFLTVGLTSSGLLQTGRLIISLLINFLLLLFNTCCKLVRDCFRVLFVNSQA